MRLDDYRAEIDTIDKHIIKLLEQRLQTVKNIGLCKQAMGKPILDASRENSKLEALRSQIDENSYSYIAEVFKEIMAQSRRFQEEHKSDYGLLGRTLGHSFSPQIHKSIGGYSYELFEVEPENLKGFFENTALKGFNVTIPYKGSAKILQFPVRCGEENRQCKYNSEKFRRKLCGTQYRLLRP